MGTTINDNPLTLQTGGMQFAGGDGSRIMDYSLYQGGLTGSKSALEMYTSAVGGYVRFFFCDAPPFVARYFAGKNGQYSKNSLWMQVKHLIEYMPTSITEIRTSGALSTAPLTGGFAGRSLNIPTGVSAGETTITIQVPEFSGFPVRQVIRDVWKDGIIDKISGFTTYGGYAAVDKYNNPLVIPEGGQVGSEGNAGIGLQINEANHSASGMLIMMARDGVNVENAIFLAHMYPTEYAMTPGVGLQGGADHPLIQASITFNAIPYESIPITAYADKILKKYYVSMNSMNLNPELAGILDNAGNIDTSGALGPQAHDFALATDIGNAPIYNYNGQYDPKTYHQVELTNENLVKLGKGQYQ
jgi:hypothetical protein